MRVKFRQEDNGFITLTATPENSAEDFNSLAPAQGAAPEGRVTATWVSSDGKSNSAAEAGDVSNKRKRITDIPPSLIGHFRETYKRMTLPLVISFKADDQAWHFGVSSATPYGEYTAHRRLKSAAHDAYEKLGGRYYIDADEPRPRPPTSLGEPQAPPNAASDVAWDGEKFIFTREADERQYEIAFNTGQRLRLGRPQQYSQEGELTPTTWKPAQYVWDGINERLRYTPSKPHKPRVSFRFRGDGEVGFDGNEPIPPTMPMGRYYTPAEPAAGKVEMAKPDPAPDKDGLPPYARGYAEGYQAGLEAAITAVARKLEACDGVS